MSNKQGLDGCPQGFWGITGIIAYWFFGYLLPLYLVYCVIMQIVTHTPANVFYY